MRRYVRSFDSLCIQHTSTRVMFVCVVVCVGASREQSRSLRPPAAGGGGAGGSHSPQSDSPTGIVRT